MKRFGSWGMLKVLCVAAFVFLAAQVNQSESKPSMDELLSEKVSGTFIDQPALTVVSGFLKDRGIATSIEMGLFEQMKKTRVTLSFSDDPLKDILTSVSELAGVSWFVVPERFGRGPSPRISFGLKADLLMSKEKVQLVGRGRRTSELLADLAKKAGYILVIDSSAYQGQGESWGPDCRWDTDFPELPIGGPQGLFTSLVASSSLYYRLETLSSGQKAIRILPQPGGPMGGYKGPLPAGTQISECNGYTPPKNKEVPLP